VFGIAGVVYQSRSLSRKVLVMESLAAQSRVGEQVSGRKRTRSRWPLLGVVAGAVFVVGGWVQTRIFVLADDVYADNALFTEAILGSAPEILFFQLATMVTIPCLVVFGVGLRGRLAEQEPAGSLKPGVAQAGLGAGRSGLTCHHRRQRTAVLGGFRPGPLGTYGLELPRFGGHL
jgi:hypothetical protein